VHEVRWAETWSAQCEMCVVNHNLNPSCSKIRRQVPSFSPSRAWNQNHHQSSSTPHLLRQARDAGDDADHHQKKKDITGDHGSLSSFFSNVREILSSRHRPPSLLQHTTTQLACRRRQSMPETSTSFARLNNSVLAHASKPNPERSPPRRNQPKTLPATATSTTDLDGESLGYATFTLPPRAST